MRLWDNPPPLTTKGPGPKGGEDAIPPPAGPVGPRACSDQRHVSPDSLEPLSPREQASSEGTGVHAHVCLWVCRHGTHGSHPTGAAGAPGDGHRVRVHLPGLGCPLISFLLAPEEAKKTILPSLGSAGLTKGRPPWTAPHPLGPPGRPPTRPSLASPFRSFCHQTQVLSNSMCPHCPWRQARHGQ